MSRSIYLCVFAVVLLAAVCHSRPSKSRVVNFKENRNQVKDWRCSEPKPRLVYLEDAYEDYDSNMKYTPNAAVLFRCDKSVGCCKHPKKECVEEESEDVSFVFQVENQFRDREPNLHLSFKNHTSCACKFKSNSRSAI